jgi:hypothetical protein
MRLSVRPYLMAGVGIVAAGTIAIPPSVAPPSAAPRHDSVSLTAQTRPVNPLVQKQRPQYATVQAATALLPAASFTSTEALTATLDTASAQVSALALPGLENAIINAYDIIMPWVDWGVNLGIYATQWIPIVNWFTPQISIFYYSLIRPIITSAVFNIAYFVGGQVSFGQGLSNFFNDTVDAGIGFVNAEIDWVLSFLPPFPPFPPFFSSLAAASVMEVVGARTAVQVPMTEEAAPHDEEVAAEDGVQTPPAEPSESTDPLPGAGEPVATEPTTPAAPETEKAEEQTPDISVDAPEAGLEDEVETPAAEIDVTDDIDLKDDEKDVQADIEPEAEADEEADGTPAPVKADTDPEPKPDAKPDTKTESGSDD